MKRINITIDEGQLAALKRLAREQISTVSRLIRDAVRDLLAKEERNDS